MITSPQNSRIKTIKHLQNRTKAREEENAFVIEGLRLIEEAQLYGWDPELVIYTSTLDERGKQLLANYREKAVPVLQVTEEVMGAASDTHTPQGLLAVLPLHKQPRPDKLDFVIIADQIRDPGNLGTLMRTALAAGVDLVLMPPGTADPHSPKVVRSGMGAHFQLPVAKIPWEEIKEQLQGLTLYAADAGGGTDYTEADLTLPLALIIGGEARGSEDETLKRADQILHIPLPGAVESLNAAVAGGILIFEVVRQRRRIS